METAQPHMSNAPPGSQMQTSLPVVEVKVAIQEQIALDLWMAGSVVLRLQGHNTLRCLLHRNMAYGNRRARPTPPPLLDRCTQIKAKAVLVWNEREA